MITYEQMNNLLWDMWEKYNNNGVEKILIKFIQELHDYNCVNMSSNFYPEKRVFTIKFNFKYGKKTKKYRIDYSKFEEGEYPHLFRI